jgi:hypothetical protein
MAVVVVIVRITVTVGSAEFRFVAFSCAPAVEAHDVDTVVVEVVVVVNVVMAVTVRVTVEVRVVVIVVVSVCANEASEAKRKGSTLSEMTVAVAARLLDCTISERGRHVAHMRNGAEIHADLLQIRYSSLIRKVRNSPL